MLKTSSLKKDLIITLSALIAATLIAVRLISFIYSKHHAQEAFDANLVKSAKLIFGLIKHEVSEEKDLKFLSDINSALQQKIFHRYEYKIHAQAWRDDYLVYSSDNFLVVQEPADEGFHDILINQESWRSFSFYDEKSKIRILVVEKDLVKNDLIFEILLSFLMPLLISLPLLFLIIAITVNKKLKSLQNLSLKVEKMSAQTMQQLSDDKLPQELQPFINSFNSLMERLTASLNAERNFTNYAAHELKTPLTAISVQAHLLVSNKNQEMEKEYAQNLLNGISRATHLINQLLTLSRVESDSANIEKEKFNLEDLTRLIIENYAQKVAEKNLTIKFSCSAKEEIFIEANKTYIEIMLGNLVDNAVKYSSKNAEIFILISTKNNRLSFKISNAGEQLLPEEIEKIFNNFYRINRLETKNNNMGCGLGLAISKKIATLYNAVIFFTSKDGINSAEVLF